MDRRDHRVGRAHRGPFWERWTTRIAVLALVTAVIGGGVYANLESVPGYAPWQDRASTLLRQIGFGGALDVYEDWRYSRHVPSDGSPDVRGLLTSTNGSATATYRFLPPLPGTADGRGWHPIRARPANSRWSTPRSCSRTTVTALPTSLRRSTPDSR